jgi:hypothetical protein
MEWYSDAVVKLYVDWKFDMVLAALLVSQLQGNNHYCSLTKETSKELTTCDKQN